jgi:hypothetical protein
VNNNNLTSDNSITLQNNTSRIDNADSTSNIFVPSSNISLPVNSIDKVFDINVTDIDAKKVGDINVNNTNNNTLT